MDSASSEVVWVMSSRPRLIRTCQETILGTSVGKRMCVADPRLVVVGSFPLVAPDALWGCDVFRLTYDPVLSNAVQALRQQKCLYDLRAVKRIFTFSDWTMRYCPPAVTCKLDSPWLSPYLFVSLCEWAVGVKLQPDSAMLFVHYQARNWGPLQLMGLRSAMLPPV